MSSTILLVTRNSAPFCTAQEAADHCRVTDGGELPRLAALVDVAVDMVEDYTGRALTLNTYRWHSTGWPTDQVDRFPWYAQRPEVLGRINLARTPLAAVQALKYYDEAGVQQTLVPENYVVDTVNTPGAVILAPGFVPPTLTTAPRVDAVTIDFTAGGSAPARAKQAVLVLVAHLYDNMSAAGAEMREIPFSLRSMLASLRVV